MHQILGALGKDSVMFLASKEFPLPVEYRFLPLEEVFHEAPVDLVDRVLVFLDCGNIDRMPVEWLQRDGARVLNIDHHHDNTRFGTRNLVDVEASSTAEIVFEIARELGAELTPEIASALYVGLVTDTGRFMYESTTPRSHRVAAELIEAGVDVDDTYRRLYEKVPIEKLRLVSQRPQRHRADAGRMPDDRVPDRGGLRGHGGERGPHRGHHRPSAVAQRRSRRRTRARQARRRPHAR